MLLFHDRCRRRHSDRTSVFPCVFSFLLDSYDGTMVICDTGQCPIDSGANRCDGWTHLRIKKRESSDTSHETDEMIDLDRRNLDSFQSKCSALFDGDELNREEDCQVRSHSCH